MNYLCTLYLLLRTTQFIEASKIPIVATAWIVAGLSAVAFLFFTISPRRGLVQNRRFAAFFAGFAILVAILATYLNYKNIKSAQEYQEYHAVYNVQASIRGTVETSDTFTFRVSSGQVNVGCNDGQSTNAVWTIPLGARNIQQVATWENTNNIKGQSQTVSVTPTMIVASGVLSGLDKNFFGNCPGGGHGELVLTGTYQLPHQSDEQQVLKTLGDKLNKGQTFIISVPLDANTKPKSCDIIITEGNRKESIHWDLAVGENGTVAVSNKTSKTYGDQPIPVDTGIKGNYISLKIL